MEFRPNLTFAMIKSDAFQNNVDREIIHRIYQEGYRIETSIRKMRLPRAIIAAFYADHVDKPYYPDLERSVIGDVMPMILSKSDHSTSNTLPGIFRYIVGSTNAREAGSFTIRGSFGGHLYDPEAPMAFNAIHASDSYDNMLLESALIFGKTTVLNMKDYGDVYLRDLAPMNTTLDEKIAENFQRHEDYILFG